MNEELNGDNAEIFTTKTVTTDNVKETSIPVSSATVSSTSVDNATRKFKISKDLEANTFQIAEEAKAIGAMSKAEYEASGLMGYFHDAKANLLGSTLERDATGVITAAEKSGLGMKALRIGAAGAGVILMGSGLKDVFVPRINENGVQEEVSWVSAGGQVVGGAILAGAGLLWGHGAVGKGVS